MSERSSGHQGNGNYSESGGAARLTLEHWIGEHPAICLGLAVVAGVSLGWLIKRK